MSVVVDLEKLAVAVQLEGKFKKSRMYDKPEHVPPGQCIDYWEYKGQDSTWVAMANGVWVFQGDGCDVDADELLEIAAFLNHLNQA